MKKFKYILLLLIPLMLVGCSKGGLVKPTEDNENIKEIPVVELAKKINDKESFVLYLHSQYCGACQQFNPTLQEAVKKADINILAIDTAELEEEDAKQLFSLIEFEYTPTTVFYKEGKEDETKRIVGAIEQDELVKKFEEFKKDIN